MIRRYNVRRWFQVLNSSNTNVLEDDLGHAVIILKGIVFQHSCLAIGLN